MSCSWNAERLSILTLPFSFSACAPVFAAGAGAPPLGSQLRKISCWADETRPKFRPSSRWERIRGSLSLRRTSTDPNSKLPSVFSLFLYFVSLRADVPNGPHRVGVQDTNNTKTVLFKRVYHQREQPTFAYVWMLIARFITETCVRTSTPDRFCQHPANLADVTENLSRTRRWQTEQTSNTSVSLCT